MSLGKKMCLRDIEISYVQNVEENKKNEQKKRKKKTQVKRALSYLCI